MTRIILIDEYKKEKGNDPQYNVMHSALQRLINSFSIRIDQSVFKKSDYEKGLVATLKSQYKKAQRNT